MKFNRNRVLTEPRGIGAAGYIANQLQLSTRTVENYLATIKSKLCCQSKLELIQKAQEIASAGFFDC